MKKVSLKDIAQEAGVSTTTVSFVLNGKAREKRISEQVNRRVLELVERLNYKPNQLARGLRTGKTKTLGLIVEDISNHFFAALARIIEDEADKYGYKVLYCSTENNTAKAHELIEMLHYRQVDGYIITPTDGIEKDIESLLQSKRPLVLMDRYFPAVAAVNHVVVDNYHGGYMAAEHFIDSGYRKIAIVTLASGQVQMKQRVDGFLAAMQAHDLQIARDMILELPFGHTRENAVAEIVRMLQSKKGGRPEAIFFTTNYLGIAGLEAFKELDLRIPDDVGVLSFDDHDIFRLHNPSISCVSQPVMEMGKKAVHILMAAMQGNTALQQHELPVSLLVRDSCASAAHHFVA